jgi:hypothetical protein
MNTDSIIYYKRDGLMRKDLADVWQLEEPGMRQSSWALVIHEKHFNRYDPALWEIYGTLQPARVLDLKWSGANRKRQALKDGTAIQLAAYAFLERLGQGVFPPVGYFVMDAQRLLTTEPQAFPGAERVDGPSPQDTWQALTTTHASQWQGVAEGHVDAPGAGMTLKERRARKAHVENGRLVVQLGCGWCDYTTLCGLAFEEEA